jgi:hypothetical protein
MEPWISPAARRRGRRPNPPGQSRTVPEQVRLTAAEREAFRSRAAAQGERRSRIHRRLIREYVTGQPDYFGSELQLLRGACDQLARVGNNLNQLVHLAHEDAWPADADLLSVLESVHTTVQSMKQAFVSDIRRVEQRRL